MENYSIWKDNIKLPGFNKLKENIEVAKRGGQVASDARKSYEKATKKSALSTTNALNYQYTEEKQIKE